MPDAYPMIEQCFARQQGEGLHLCQREHSAGGPNLILTPTLLESGEEFYYRRLAVLCLKEDDVGCLEQGQCPL